MAVRAKFDLLVVVPVEAADDGGRTGVAETDDDGKDDTKIPTDSFCTSLSDKLFRFRGKVDCALKERSDTGSIDCSESDRERDGFSTFIVPCFREEERSGISVDTCVGSGGDENR